MNPSPASPVCPQCGAELRAESPQGLCPVCLLLGPDAPMSGMQTALLGYHSAAGPAGGRDQPEDDAPPEAIGPYRIIEKLGEGGFGIVYRAEQTGPLRREVALKIIKPGMDSRLIIRRFEAERQTLALMEHPHIAAVLSAGTTEKGRPYFVMELVRGQAITTYCDSRSLPVHERLELFIPVCLAVQHAHQKAVLHRDLKPSNILVTEVDGRPAVKVIDFGIAKALAATTGAEGWDTMLRTQAGMVVGTPQYMSPEQAGAAHDLDTRSDIYTLGVILYELLTGRTPFPQEKLHSGALDEVLRVIRESEPPRPSSRMLPVSDSSLRASERRQTDPARLNRALRGDLDWITLKALEKERERRYGSAAALARDLERYLAGEPVEAGPPGARYRLSKLIRRNKLAFGAAAALLTMLVAGIIVSTAQWRSAVHERELKAQETERAEESSRAARRERDKAEENLYFSSMLLSAADIAAGRPASAGPLLERHLPDPGRADLRGWEWYCLYGELNKEAVRVQAHQGSLNGLAVSPDGLSVATVGDDGRVTIRETTGFTQTAAWKAHETAVLCIAWSPDGQWLATGDAAGTVTVWGASAHVRFGQIAFGKGAVRTLAWQPGTGEINQLAGGGAFPEIILWKFSPGSAPEPLVTLHENGGGTHSLAWSRDGRILAAGMGDTEMSTRLIQADGGEVIFSDKAGQGSDVNSVAFSPASDDFIVGTKHFQLRRYNRAGRRRVVLPGVGGRDDQRAPLIPAPGNWTLADERTIHRGFISALAYSPDGSRYASAAADGTIRLGGSDAVLAADTGGLVTSIVWSVIPESSTHPETEALFSGHSDGTLRVWRPQISAVTGKTSEAVWHTEIDNWVARVRWNPEGTLIAVADFKDGIRIFDPASGRMTGNFIGRTGNFFDLAWSPDGSRIAAAGRGPGCIAVFDTVTQVELLQLRQDRPLRVNWSPDGKRLAGCGSPVDTRIWDAETGELLKILPIAAGQVKWRPDGRCLAVGGRDGSIILIDSDSYRQIAVLRTAPPPLPGAVANEIEPPRHIADLAWNPSGTLLGYVAWDSTAAIIDPADGQEIRRYAGHTGGIYEMDWHPDQDRIATCGQDGTIRLYTSGSSNQVMQLSGGDGVSDVRSLDWSSDGLSLAAGCFDRSVQVFDIKRGLDAAGAKLFSDTDSPAAIARQAGRLARLGRADGARRLVGPAGADNRESSDLQIVSDMVENTLIRTLSASTGWRPPPPSTLRSSVLTAGITPERLIQERLGAVDSASSRDASRLQFQLYHLGIMAGREGNVASAWQALEQSALLARRIRKEKPADPGAASAVNESASALLKIGQKICGWEPAAEIRPAQAAAAFDAYREIVSREGGGGRLAETTALPREESFFEALTIFLIGGGRLDDATALCRVRLQAVSNEEPAGKNENNSRPPTDPMVVRDELLRSARKQTAAARIGHACPCVRALFSEGRWDEAADLLKTVLPAFNPSGTPPAGNVWRDLLIYLAVNRRHSGDEAAADGYYRTLCNLNPEAVTEAWLSAVGLPEEVHRLAEATRAAILERTPELRPPWKAVFFSWSNAQDPVENEAAWRQASAKPEALRAELWNLELLYGGEGPEKLVFRRSGAGMVGDDRFGMIAKTLRRFEKGRWRLDVSADDGVRVRLNGNLVIDEWKYPQVETFMHEFEVSEAADLEVEVEHFDEGGSAVLAVSFRQIVEGAQ